MMCKAIQAISISCNEHNTFFVGRWVGLPEGLSDGTDVGGEVGRIEGG